MNCCSGQLRSTERTFGFLSKLYERRYRRKGLDEQQKWMLEEISKHNITDASVLDVGCGVGVIHQSLLTQGAAKATGVDIAPRMLELAKQRADERCLTEQVAYHLGDFVELQSEIEAADITVLDKVICCYPAYRVLLEATTTHSRKLIALIYPRKHRFSILWNHLWNFGFWLFRSDFRGFVHDPVQVEQLLTSRGFNKTFNRNTFLWHTQVFVAD